MAKTRWEYRAVELPSPSKSDIIGVLDALGEEGWELVSVSEPERMNLRGYLYLFKRKKCAANGNTAKLPKTKKSGGEIPPYILLKQVL